MMRGFNQYPFFTSCKLLTLLSGILAFHIGQASEIPPWDKLAEHQEAPDWFRDAKFGIYLHWGAYSVAERGEWYARKLYIEGEDDYKHHIKTYGHPSEFGYADFIPLWKAENFDPEGLENAEILHILRKF